MKKFLFVLLGGFVVMGAFAAGENVPTSKSYVDSKLSEKQDIIPKNDGATQVLTNTGTVGEYGTKGIYDTNGAYATQTQNLVDAATMNAGVQNAIDSEFQCIEWLDPNDHSSDCLLMDVFGTPPQQILPTGYTALEYIKSTGTQYIDTNVPWASVKCFHGKAVQTNLNTSWNLSLLGGSVDKGYTYNAFFGTAYWGSQGGIREWYWNTNILPTTTVEFDICANSASEWAGYINGISTVGVQTSFFNGNVWIMNTADSILYRRAFMGYTWYIKLNDVNGDALFNGIPARRNSDGEIGMYDTVTNTFFTNSGTGEFIAGPVVNLYLPVGN